MGLSRVAPAALALGAALMLTPSVASAWPAAGPQPLGVGPLVAAQPVETPSPTTSATSAPTPVQSAPAVQPQVDQRTGGSAPAPGRGKPGWVWWALAAVGIILVVGVLRLWRSAAD